MSKIWEWLKGKKTYMLCFGLIAVAVARFLGDQDLNALIRGIVEAFAGMSIRHGISTAGNGTDGESNGP